MSAFTAIIIATTPIPSSPEAHLPAALPTITASHASVSALSIAVSQQASAQPSHPQHTPVIHADIAGVLSIEDTQLTLVSVGNAARQEVPAVPAPVVPPIDEAAAAETIQNGPAPVGPGDVTDATDAVVNDPNAIIVTAEEAPKHDPLQQLNAQTFEVMQGVDEALVAPVAKAYEKGLPTPLRKAVSNFFNNLGEPVVFLNFLLQGKPGKAMETLGRFAINTTLGIGGLRDTAKTQPFNLPNRENGFSNTLGFYGVGHGPFFVLPLVGPTTLRDLAGGGIDNFVMPVGIAQPLGIAKYLTHPAVGASAFTLGSLDDRIEIDDKLQGIRDSVNPYSVMRETYLCERKADIEALHNREGPDCSIEAIEAQFEWNPDADTGDTISSIDNVGQMTAEQEYTGQVEANSDTLFAASPDITASAHILPETTEAAILTQVQIEPAPIAATDELSLTE